MNGLGPCDVSVRMPNGGEIWGESSLGIIVKKTEMGATLNEAVDHRVCDFGKENCGAWRHLQIGDVVKFIRIAGGPNRWRAECVEVA